MVTIEYLQHYMVYKHGFIQVQNCKNPAQNSSEQY